jgi:hypothetical protein
MKFKPYSFLKSLANPIIDIRFELQVPLNKGFVKKNLKKKLRCFNSKTMKLTQEQRKNCYSLSIFNNLDVNFTVKKIEVLDKPICGE